MDMKQRRMLQKNKFDKIRCCKFVKVLGARSVMLLTAWFSTCLVYSQDNRTKIPADFSIETNISIESDIADAVITETHIPEEWHRKLYVKTNLVGLGLAIVNAAVEMDLAKHWSVTLPIYYSAWNYFSSSVKFRTFSIQPEARYWFVGNNDRWFMGIHLGMAYYNFATGGEYRTQDHDGASPAWGGGISLGYRMPISEDNRWKMEFSLGAGVCSLHYDKFRNEPNGLLTKIEKKAYFGIDQAAVSLTYTFDLKKKGGHR